jgi:hypothetical protein
VCGCDGTTYDNDCIRRHAGVQKAKDGTCECVPLTAPCETACDCYEKLGQTFCLDCPLLCPSCGDYWQCKDGACVEECGIFPPDLRFCFEPGCATSADCADDAYCAMPLGECAARGMCEPRPLGCPDVYLPVCGCDGKTYGNRCDAAAAGISVAHEGECRDVCGGIASIPCPDNQFCELPASECGSADLQGRCVEVTDACPEFYSPVCGCDGVTYANDCFRQAAKAQKAYDGTCEGVCGGVAGIPCPDGEFCELPAGECHSADLQGRCVETGGACPQVYDPVCSCDGKTYPNDCERQLAGAQKGHDGPCESDSCTGRVCTIVCGDGGCKTLCPPICETACDCYAVLGNSFCEACPLLCPNCGSYWECKDSTCVEQCGQLPPDVTSC